MTSQPSKLPVDIRFIGTSPGYYLSGTTALNIPSATLTGGWHLTSILSQISVQLNMAGEGAHAFVNTNPDFGQEGVFECSQKLIEFGANLPIGIQVYAANHHRAVLDLLVMTARNLQNPAFIHLPDYFDSIKEQRDVRAFVTSMLPRLKPDEAQHIQDWLHQS